MNDEDQKSLHRVELIKNERAGMLPRIKMNGNLAQRSQHQGNNKADLHRLAEG